MSFYEKMKSYLGEAQALNPAIILDLCRLDEEADELPVLVNAAVASDIMLGKESIDGAGDKVTGTRKTYNVTWVPNTALVGVSAYLPSGATANVDGTMNLDFSIIYPSIVTDDSLTGSLAVKQVAYELGGKTEDLSTEYIVNTPFFYVLEAPGSATASGSFVSLSNLPQGDLTITYTVEIVYPPVEIVDPQM